MRYSKLIQFTLKWKRGGGVDNSGITFVDLELGSHKVVKNSGFKNLFNAEATRVTSANLLHHLRGDRKRIAVEQMLLLARFGIAQFHPAYARKSLKLPEVAAKLGADVSIDRVPIRSAGQLLYTAVTINHTVTVHEQPDKMTPRSRTKLAEIILQAIS